MLPGCDSFVLLSHARLITQLTQLERSPARSGKDNISHPPHAHDDIINAVAGAIVMAQAAAATQITSFPMPVFGGTPRYVPGGSALQYADVFVPGTGNAVAPREDWRNYVDGAYVGPGQRWWGPV
jgi:hypothetical protein